MLDVTVFVYGGEALQDLLLVFLEFFFELQVCTGLGEDTPLSEFLYCILEAELIATFEIGD